MIKRNIPNLLVISICNTYTGTKKQLSGVNKDIEMMESLNKTHNIRVHILKNKGKKDLMNSLDEEVKYYGDNGINTEIDTVIIHYSGHGYRSESDEFEGFLSNDNEYIGLMEVLSKFKKYRRLMCIFDGCRSKSSKKGNPDYDKIKNVITILLYGAEKGDTCLVSSEGSYLTTAFYNIFTKLKLLSKTMTSFDLMSITLGTIMKYTQIMEKKVPNIYLNNYLRKHYPEFVYAILDITNQNYDSIMVTRINDAVRDDQFNLEIVRTEIKKKIKDKILKLKNLLIDVNRCTDELKQLEIYINNLNTHITNLTNESEKLYKARQIINNWPVTKKIDNELIEAETIIEKYQIQKYGNSSGTAIEMMKDELLTYKKILLNKYIEFNNKRKQCKDIKTDSKNIIIKLDQLMKRLDEI